MSAEEYLSIKTSAALWAIGKTVVEPSITILFSLAAWQNGAAALARKNKNRPVVKHFFILVIFYPSF
jgi:dolichyl-phosphate-mannose--protein O-mannosyl transferase